MSCNKVSQFYNYAHFGNYAEEQLYHLEKKAFNKNLSDHMNDIRCAYQALFTAIDNARLDIRCLKPLDEIIRECIPAKFK